MARHLVCLTFDFDALSGWIARGLVTPTPISRGEFGVVGAARLLALLAKHDIRATWFIPGVTIATYRDSCKAVVDAGHEIGNHGWTHVPPAKLSRVEEAAGLARANEAIAALAGRAPQGYRSPSWDLSPHTVELLIEHGFAYESSMMGHDYLPYRARKGDVIALDEAVSFGPETELVEMPISWSLDDYPHFEFVRTETTLLPGLMNARDVIENWIDDFTYMARHYEWGVLTYTCHPFVIGRGHRMLAFERLIEALKVQGAVFVTMAEAVAEWRAQGEPRNRGVFAP
ncbi:MAG TPA: polysaccharide deacetylase [Alphaproteobacteria bacterium]